MGNTWLYADPHAYHHGICKFTRRDGSPLRPWDDAEEMTERMIGWYNDVVKPDDRVYIMGDVAMNRKALDRFLPRLLGRKCLVKGNHDTDKLSYYAQYFDDIRSCVQKKGFVLTHIPLHPACLDRWGLNIHGHLHDNVIQDKWGYPDPKYLCVSVEHTDYRPILLDEALKRAGVK